MLVLPKPIGLKQLHVSPIHSPYLSSDASTDEEVPPIHPQQYLPSPAIEQLHGLVVFCLFSLFCCKHYGILSKISLCKFLTLLN